MQTPVKTKPTRGLSLDQHIDRLRDQLARLAPFLSTPPSASALAEVDAATERLISDVFGEASDKIETYEYAQLGEAASMLNLQEEAREGSEEDTERESLRQRRRVLESCIWELEAKRAANAKTRSPITKTAPRVSDYMSEGIRSLHATATLKQAGQLMEQYNIGFLFVEDDQRYVGTITDSMLSRTVVAQGLDANTTLVGSCMNSRISSIEAHEPIVEAVRLMKDRGIRHVAVTRDDAIVGVLSVSDLLRYYSGV